MTEKIDLEKRNGIKKIVAIVGGFVLGSMLLKNAGSDVIFKKRTGGSEIRLNDLSKRIASLKVYDDATAATIGDGKLYFTIPSDLNGFNLIDADAALSTASTSGLPTIQIANVTDTTDMLLTKISIDANEKTSWTAVTPPVIDTTKDDVVRGDLLRVDVDVAGTGAKGLEIILVFQQP